MSGPALILASASPRRSALLREMGLEFRTLPSSVEEVTPAHLSPHEICQINAYRKAWAIAKQNPDALVLGADTLVFLGERVYGKPHDLDQAMRMLSELQGQTHHVVTGVCLIYHRLHQQSVFAESTAVTFRALAQEDIADYLKVVNPLDKAGAYAIQEHGEKIVSSIQGSYSNVVGLPLERLKKTLTALAVLMDDAAPLALESDVPKAQEL